MTSNIKYKYPYILNVTFILKHLKLSRLIRKALHAIKILVRSNLFIDNKFITKIKFSCSLF